MRTTIRWVDVTRNIENKEQPVVLIERELMYGKRAKGEVFNLSEIARLGSFWVATAPVISQDENPHWSLVAKEKYVRVPVHAYLTAERAKSHLLVTGIEIGVRAAFSYHDKVKKPIEELILVIGHQVDDLAPKPHFRGYVGVVIKENNNPS